MKRIWRAGCLPILALFVVAPAASQDFSPLAASSTALGSAISSSHAFADTMRGAYGASGTHRPAAGPSPVAPSRAAPVRTTFAVSLERRRAHVAAFIDRVKRVDPANGAVIEQAFAKQDMIAAWMRSVADVGLHGNDLADVYATYWIDAWQAAHGDFGDPPRPAVLAVRAQTARALAGVAAVASVGDAGRQDLAEELILTTMMIESQAQRAKLHPEERPALARWPRASARHQSVMVDGVRLTPQGFVPG